MLYKKQGGAVFFYKLLYLHSRENVDVVEGFVPYIKVCLLAEGTGNEQLFLLSCAEAANVLLKLDAGEIELAEYSTEQAYVNAAFLLEAGKGTAEL